MNTSNPEGCPDITVKGNAIDMNNDTSKPEGHNNINNDTVKSSAINMNNDANNNTNSKSQQRPYNIINITMPHMLIIDRISKTRETRKLEPAISDQKAKIEDGLIGLNERHVKHYLSTRTPLFAKFEIVSNVLYKCLLRITSLKEDDIEKIIYNADNNSGIEYNYTEYVLELICIPGIKYELEKFLPKSNHSENNVELYLDTCYENKYMKNDAFISIKDMLNVQYEKRKREYKPYAVPEYNRIFPNGSTIEKTSLYSSYEKMKKEKEVVFCIRFYI